jgi:RNA polymerase sigma-70 factor (ECF subfamily)
MTAVALTLAPAAETAPAAARQQLNQQFGQLIQAIAQGDQDALARFYDHTHCVVFSLALRILNDRSAAEEVTLDVFLQVWQQASRYSAERGSPLAWLLTIARSRALDRLRNAAHTRRETEPLDNVLTFAASAATPEEASLLAARGKQVRAALALLPSEQREVLTSAYFAGLTQTEIAAQFNLPLGTVKTRMRSGLSKLRQHLLNN